MHIYTNNMIRLELFLSEYRLLVQQNTKEFSNLGILDIQSLCSIWLEINTIQGPQHTYLNCIMIFTQQ